MDRPPLSPSKVEKAKEAIEFLSSIPVPQCSDSALSGSSGSASSSASGNRERKDGTLTRHVMVIDNDIGRSMKLNVCNVKELRMQLL